MKREVTLAGVLTMIMACAPPPEDETPVPGTGNEAASAACDASKAQSLVGQEGTQALAEEARRLTGAETVRFLRPGQIVTMEYRFDRLNVVVDEANRVTAIRCG
jgi:hypothetical protein